MITICSPVKDLVCAKYTYDLAQLLRHSPEVIYTICTGSILPNQRHKLTKTSLENGASHILWIDSDQRFPPNTLKMLLKHDLDIVGANVKKREIDEFTARSKDKFIDSTGKKGIEEADVLGFGVTLVKTKIFTKLPKPWYAMPWDGEAHVGEDVYFSHIARENGFKIWIDHDLSQLIKHMGMVEFGV